MYEFEPVFLSAVILTLIFIKVKMISLNYLTIFIQKLILETLLFYFNLIFCGQVALATRS